MVNLQNPYRIVRHYPEQNYYAFFNQKTGFFARVEDYGCEEPFWSWHGPELLDISITNWCDRECPICYRESNPNGKNMLVGDYEMVMQQASRMHVFQVALGGGNPNQHPDFCEIIRLTREKYNIVPSYTTNGRGLTDRILCESKKYCGAVAVSAYPPYEETKGAVELLYRYGIRTNIHFVIDRNSVETAIGWLEHPPGYFDMLNAIIFLNYKPVGRGNYCSLLLKHSDKLEKFFMLATCREHKFKIGFDSCMASGLVNYTNISPTLYEGCESGRFSMFISEDMRMYPCSFMATDYEGIKITENNILEKWRNSQLFRRIRDKITNNACQTCKHTNVCLGGCPIFEEITLCPRKVKTCIRFNSLGSG